MLTVYEYRPTPSAPHLLVVKYGNLFFTVGATPPASNGVDTAAHSRTASQSSTVDELARQLQSAQLRIDELSQGGSPVSNESLAKLQALVKNAIEKERQEYALRLQRLEESLLENIRSLQSSSQRVATAPAAAVAQAPSRSPPPSRQTPPPTVDNWSIATEQRLVYEGIFDQNDTERKGVLSGSQVSEILSRSKLPKNVLAQIWSLASLNRGYALNKAEFCIAMFITTRAVSGVPLPEAAPHALVYSSGYTLDEEIHDESSDEDEPPVERKVQRKKSRK